MKKILALALSIIMLISVTSVITVNASEFVVVTSADGLWSYCELDTGYYVFEYLGTDTDVTLPETIDGHPINKISLQRNEVIQNLTIPKNYIYFHDYAFSGMTNLETVTFQRDYTENEIKEFGPYLFSSCKHLKKAVLPNLLPRTNIHSGLRPVGDEWYEGTQLPQGLFLDCKHLKDVTLPENLTEIEHEVFNNCTAMKEIIVPDGVKYVGAFAGGCTSLEKLVLPDSVEIATFGCEMEGNKCTIVYNEKLTSLTETIDWWHNGSMEPEVKKLYANIIPVPVPEVADTENVNAAVEKAETEHKNQNEWLPGVIETEPTEPTTPPEIVEVSEPELAKTKISLKAGQKHTLKVLYGYGVKWATSNKKVAKVTKNGTVTALKKGKATITVKFTNGKKQKCKVTVKTNPKLNKTKKTLKVNKKFKLNVTGKVGKVKFKTSNKKVAIVSKKGTIKAKKKGKATITVTVNGIKLKCKITVKK